MSRATNDTTNANAKASMPKMRIGKFACGRDWAGGRYRILSN